MLENMVVRAFDGSLADAEGLLAIEKATFDESPYDAREIQAMLIEGPQRAWLATVGGHIVGFAIAFPTNSLCGPCWEIDLLAVHANWTRRGLATRLIRAASAHGATMARRARAAVATDNAASAATFRRAGFRAGPETCALLIFRPEKQELSSSFTTGITVREAASVAEITAWLPQDLATNTPPESKPVEVVREPSLQAQRIVEPANHSGQTPLSILVAEQNGRVAGYAELVRVQTLLYQGVWIESLAASTPPVRAALAHEVVSRGIAAALDEIGAMAPADNRPLRETLQATGFCSLGDFYLFTARLPLPGLAQGTPPGRRPARNEKLNPLSRDIHV